MSKITVVLTKYKRTNLFDEQVKSIENQSIKPIKILICDNTIDNLGVWARFSLALNSKTDFVCVIDDDTIPGIKWLENCLSNMEQQEGLYGTCGYLFRNKDYKTRIRVGWPKPNEKRCQVDYVVHNWFFKKKWLEHYWSEIPDAKYWLCGEDMHFSYQLQKKGIDTFVPPHPLKNKDLWGSLNFEYGRDCVSLWESNVDDFRNKMFEFFANQINKGWKLQNEKYKNEDFIKNKFAYECRIKRKKSLS